MIKAGQKDFGSVEEVRSFTSNALRTAKIQKPLSDEEMDVIVDVVKLYHPKADEKIGVGVVEVKTLFFSFFFFFLKQKTKNKKTKK